MKKVLALILAAFMMLTMFAACGDEKGSENSSEKLTEDKKAVKAAVEDYVNAAMDRTYVEKKGETPAHYLVLDYVAEDTKLYGIYKEAVEDWKDDRRTILAAKVDEVFGGEIIAAFGELLVGDEIERLTKITDAFTDKDEENKSKYLDDLAAAYCKIEDIKLNIAPVAEDKEETTSATATVTISRLNLEKFDEIMTAIIENWNDEKVDIAKVLDSPEFRLSTKATVTFKKIEGKWLVTDDVEYKEPPVKTSEEVPAEQGE